MPEDSWAIRCYFISVRLIAVLSYNLIARWRLVSASQPRQTPQRRYLPKSWIAKKQEVNKIDAPLWPSRRRASETGSQNSARVRADRMPRPD